MHLSPKTRSFFPLPSLGFLHTNRLAGLPQTLRRSFWALQRFCKSAFPHFGVCRTSARTLFLILVFAELLQGRFSPFWRLQDSCKSHGKLFGVCGSPASPTENFLVPAGVPQTLALIQYEEWERSLSAVHAKKQALVSLLALLGGQATC